MASSATAPAVTSYLTVGVAPAAAMGMTYLAMSRTIAAVMGNAATAQHHGQRIGTAGTTMACAQILAKGIASAK